MCASEPLTRDARSRIRRAWAVEPFDVYAATETAGIASECAHHRLHLFDDLVITEVVDERNRAVPPGARGAKILVTVLFSRTEPLIRYEMSDTVTLATEPCPCGLPFQTIDGIDGRLEDTLVLPGARGQPVRVHPNVFHRALEALPVREWQVVQEPARIRVLLVGLAEGVDGAFVAAGVRREVERAGAVVPEVSVERVDHVERTTAGKAPLVRALRAAHMPPQPRAGTRV